MMDYDTISKFCHLIKEINKLNDFLDKNQDLWKKEEFKDLHKSNLELLRGLQIEFSDCFHTLYFGCHFGTII